VRLYRARAWRAGPLTFDPLDSSGSIAGAGWRFNDPHTEILYAATVEALATLEVAVRPGWEAVKLVLIATIELPDGLVTDPADLGLRLPGNWNARPVATASRSIAREFLNAIAVIPASSRPIGLRVPSVLSQSDYNVLIDPARKALCSAKITHRLPFNALLTTHS
jgi:RES domain-containing protein